MNRSVDLLGAWKIAAFLAVLLGLNLPAKSQPDFADVNPGRIFDHPHWAGLVMVVPGEVVALVSHANAQVEMALWKWTEKPFSFQLTAADLSRILSAEVSADKIRAFTTDGNKVKGPPFELSVGRRIYYIVIQQNLQLGRKLFSEKKTLESSNPPPHESSYKDLSALRVVVIAAKDGRPVAIRFENLPAEVLIEIVNENGNTIKKIKNPGDHDLELRFADAFPVATAGSYRYKVITSTGASSGKFLIK